MNDQPIRVRAPEIRALTRDIAGAPDPQIMRIVATVDAMMNRGSADQLVAPLRQRLKMLRPPRPLRFARLMFYPLEALIVPAAHWQRGQQSIPRTAIMPMSEHVRLIMGAEADLIQEALVGRTTADTDQISRLGRTLWPRAAQILAGPAIPEWWEDTELGVAAYRPLADLVVALLPQAAALDTMCSDTANGLLLPDPDAIATMVNAVARASKAALPSMLSLLLSRLPKAAPQLMRLPVGSEATTVQSAFDQAADLLLQQLDENDGVEARIATGSLADAGAAVNRINALLEQLDTVNIKPKRREQLRTVRKRLDAGCRARFASGLQDEVLAPLQHMGVAPSSAELATLEAAARGLRILETEARVVAGGSAYDLLLGRATDAIRGDAMRDRLLLTDQVRLVEILAGSEAALAMLKSHA